MPGFHDAHNHMAWFGIGLDDVPLGPEHCKHVDDVYDAIAKRAKEQPPGSWITGSGYDQTKLVGGHPNRHRLDRAAPDHHVRLKHTSGHMSVVNSLVLGKLDLANVPVGGDVCGRTPTGPLTPRSGSTISGRWSRAISRISLRCRRIQPMRRRWTTSGCWAPLSAGSGLRSLREEHRALAWSFVLAEVLQRRAAALNSMKGPV